MALSKNFRVCDSFARAEQFCQDVELNRVPPGSLLAMFKRRVQTVVTFAGGALNIFYQASEDLALAAVSAQMNVYSADASALSFFRISAVTVPIGDLATLTPGDNGVYNPIGSKEGFYRVIRNVERQSSSRNFYLELGNSASLIYCHAPYAAGIANINVAHKRTPDITFTLADAQDPTSTVYMDVPDFYVPHVEMAAAIDALKQAGIKENQMSGLIDEHKEVMTALNQLYKAEEADLRNRGVDQ